MAMKILPPGFRFHPTDVELLKYYLKRKILDRPLHFDAIREVNIYQLDPWELPGLSCLKTDDQKWYFFCPRERRYAQGGRAKRSTRGGFWKTTGRDRAVMYNGESVGMIKTLIFHEGRAPQGSRTDWVMHEYRLDDPGLAAREIPQDSYVLCAIFKKKGIGPQNGAQYGAPFREEDWEDDEISVVLPSDVLINARGSVEAPPPAQEQQTHCASNQIHASNDISKSIQVVGSPPPVDPASETVLPEPSGISCISATAVISHAHEAIVEGPADEPDDGMDIGEILAMICTSPVNENNLETQAVAAPGYGVPATVGTAAAYGDDIFADLPDLDVRMAYNHGEFVELLDLGQHRAETHTPPGDIQEARVGIGNVSTEAQMEGTAWLESCRYCPNGTFNGLK